MHMIESELLPRPDFGWEEGRGSSLQPGSGISCLLKGKGHWRELDYTRGPA